jgi:O-antigen ligase
MIVFYFLVAVMPLSEHRIWGRMLGNLTVFKYLGAAAVIYAVAHICAKGAIPRYFRTRQARLFVLFCGIACFSYLTKSLGGNLETSPIFSYVSFLVLFFVTLTVVDSVSRLRLVTLTAVGAVAFASLYVIREWQKYHDVYMGFRPGWVVGDPNYFTISALLTLPLAFYLMLGAKRAWERCYSVGCLIVILIAVTLGASRGGFVGLVVAFVFLIWHSRQRVRNLALLGALILPMSLMFPISPLGRLLHPNRSDLGAEDQRTATWQAGLLMMKDHPVLGIGLGNFKPLVGDYEPPDHFVDHIAHNAYIEIGAEMGIPALLIFLGILVSSFRTLSSIRGRAFPPAVRSLGQTALGLQAGLLGTAVAIFFVSGQYQKMLWLVVFVSMSMSTITRQYLEPPIAGGLKP